MHDGMLRIGSVEAWAHRVLVLAQYYPEEGVYAAQRGPVWLTEEVDERVGVSITEMHLCFGPVQIRLGRSVLA